MQDARRVSGTASSQQDLGGGKEAEAFGIPNYHRVRDAMRADIARGTLERGSRLKIGDLSRRYGLSPAPIREALGQLEAEGWVVISPNRGASVRDINELVLRELNEVRLALESYIVRRAAEVATRSDVASLEVIQDEYESVMAHAEPRALLEINHRFHSALRAVRPNAEAAAIITRQNKFFMAMRAEWGYQPHRPKEIAHEHRLLLQAFRCNDGGEAERISREHIQHAIDDLLERWK